jgi:anti-sigma regulatory factor (Ser/Thr protein kinase)
MAGMVKPDPPTALNGHLPPPPDRPITTNRTMWAVPEDVGHARRITAETMAGVGDAKHPHVADVILVVDELVTNAARHACGGRRVWVGLDVRSRWTHVAVEDRDPEVHRPPAKCDGDLPESGRGLEIVKAVSERFEWELGSDFKRAHAFIVRPNVSITPDDVAAMDAEMPGE